ncbi:hypothetical protein A5641_14345 [Mycobacterium sp. 1554424.7]|nr:hypothetical protein A5641_14345 [Mycobacterium sp. 1554424.7]
MHAGWIDTEYGGHCGRSEAFTRQRRSQTLAAIQHGDEEVLTDDRSRQVKASLPHDLASL